ncbi:universal stress protein [Myxococcota bacterium]|nr:universal stress protein [Myxococcota bacterium]
MKKEKILVPIDFSNASRCALAEADNLAMEQEGNLTLLHVHPIVEMAVLDFTYIQSPEKIAEACNAAQSKLREWAKDLKTPPERIDISSLPGSPVATIVRQSGKHDLVVMSTHGRSGVPIFLLGSTTYKVVRAARCSVLIHKKACPDEE